MHQNHIRNSKSVPGVITPDARRLGAPPQTPVPDWESEKVATLTPTCLVSASGKDDRDGDKVHCMD